MVQSGESRLAGVRWLRLAGRREDVFTRLGELAADEVHAVQEALPERASLRAWAATPSGAARMDRLRTLAERTYPEVLVEIDALAAGASADPTDLLLANLRGDIGVPDGTGCTDLAVAGARHLVAHNEDGAPALAGAFMFLTLRIDDEPAVTTQWYPGFAPANAHAVTETGLAWGINHVQVTDPADAPGRHFLARALQRSRTLDDALDLLRRRPSAGGFAYTIGECGTGRVAVAEVAAGRADIRPVDHSGVWWHTNHLRQLPGSLDAEPARTSAGTDALGQREESERRGRWLDAHVRGHPDATPDWLTTVLAADGLPHGVRRFATDGDPLMTLMTTVVDLDAATVHLRNPTGATDELTVADYLAR